VLLTAPRTGGRRVAVVCDGGGAHPLMLWYPHNQSTSCSQLLPPWPAKEAALNQNWRSRFSFKLFLPRSSGGIFMDACTLHDYLHFEDSVI